MWARHAVHLVSGRTAASPLPSSGTPLRISVRLQAAINRARTSSNSSVFSVLVVVLPAPVVIILPSMVPAIVCVRRLVSGVIPGPPAASAPSGAMSCRPSRRKPPVPRLSGPVPLQVAGSGGQSALDGREPSIRSPAMTERPSGMRSSAGGGCCRGSARAHARRPWCARRRSSSCQGVCKSIESSATRRCYLAPCASPARRMFLPCAGRSIDAIANAREGKDGPSSSKPTMKPPPTSHWMISATIGGGSREWA